MLKGIICATAILATCGPSFSDAAFQGTFNGTFEPIKAETCISPSFFNGYTSYGKQYLDPNNGVLADQYTMSARWQGDHLLDNFVSYDMSPYTGVQLTNKRGYQPENASAATPGIQLYCYDIGLLLNSWWNPHRPIPGGGYNDMWGYAWSAANMPRPFIENGKHTHLVLQATGGVNLYFPSFASDHVNANTGAAAAQLGLFAYLVDTVHPTLHPIVIIAGMYDSEWNANYAANGITGRDYSSTLAQQYATAYPSWFPNGASGDGVWFASAPISKSSTQHFVDTYYTAGEENSALGPVNYGGNPPMAFFRGHVSFENMQNIIASINGACGCGYSTDPSNYALQYAGIIAETRIRSEIRELPQYNFAPTSQFDVDSTHWIPNDSAKDQVSFGAHVYAVGVYRGVPN